MALTSALSAQNKTDIRSDDYRVLQFLCLVPNEVVVQFQTATEPASVYATIDADTIVTGDMADVREGMTVLYSTSTDYQQTETFRTRVRAGSTASVLNVAENSQTLTTALYVTVLNTYQVQEKLQKSATLKDWDITYRRLLPIETALPSAIVVTNGGTSYTSVAAPIVMDADASSIDTHAWESSNSNDSFDDTAIAQPVVTLEADAFRWLRYTFTDDLGNSNFRVIPCWTVPKDYSAQVITGWGSESGDFAQISYDAELGWACTVPAFADIENILNGTYAVVACDEWINGSRQSIRSNINFVGYLQNESTTTRGDSRFGQLSETVFQMEGFGHQLARQNIASQRIVRTASPSAWGDIEDPTPARMLTYHLSENSTIFHLCSLTIPADDGNFVSDDLSVANGKALDDIRTLTEVVNAELQFDVDGKLDLARNLIYLDDTARDAATEVVTILTTDVLDYTLDYDYGSQTSQAELFGGAYDSSNDVYDLYKAMAPAVARLSEGDPLKVVNQVLPTDASASDAQAELKERAANYFAAGQPTYTLRITFKDEFHFIVPDVGAWYPIPLIEDDTVRGKVFGSSDRWQCVSMTHTANNRAGTRSVEGTFRLETQDTGAMVYVTPIQHDPAADINYLPAVFAPWVGGDLGLTGGVWYDSDDPQPPSDPNPADEDCELLGLRNNSTANTTETTNPALLSEKIETVVRGFGLIRESDGWCFDFDSGSSPSLGVYENATEDNIGGASATERGVWSGSKWLNSQGIASGGGSRNEINVYYDMGADYTIDDWSIVVSRSATSGDDSLRVGVQTDAGANLWAIDTNLGSGGQDEETFTSAIARTGRYIRIICSTTDMDGSAYAWVHSLQVSADSGANPIGADNCAVPGTTAVYGDAFYEYDSDGNPSAFASGFGLQVEGGDVSSIPPYSPTHEYTFYETVTSGPVDYSYDTPYAYGDGDPFSLQLLVCFLGV